MHFVPIKSLAVYKGLPEMTGSLNPMPKKQHGLVLSPGLFLVLPSHGHKVSMDNWIRCKFAVLCCLAGSLPSSRNLHFCGQTDGFRATL